jgi:hypothetical protein
MVSHKDICENYIKSTLEIKNPKNINNNRLKVDYAIDSQEGIICFEAEGSTETTNESDLHLLGHLIYQIMFNSRENKKIYKFYWLFGPGCEFNKYQNKIESWIGYIKPLLSDKSLLPIQEFDEFR